MSWEERYGPGPSRIRDELEEIGRAIVTGQRRIYRPVADMIRECHAVFGEEEHAPTPIPTTRAELRQSMIEEEVAELRAAATDSQDLVSIADALADIVYVAYGTAFAYGIPLDEVVAEVHRSNLTKDFTGAEGEDKKLAKGPGYEPPHIAPILDASRRRFELGGTPWPRQRKSYAQR